MMFSSLMASAANFLTLSASLSVAISSSLSAQRNAFSSNSTRSIVSCFATILERIVIRTRLHQASESMLRQLCDDASDTVLIENNGVAPEVTTHFQATPLFSIRTVLLVSSERCCSIDADARCKQALKMHSHSPTSNAKAKFYH